MAEKGRYDHRWSPAEPEALRRLAASVQASGARLVLHTPPVSDIFLEHFERRGGRKRWCEVSASIARPQRLEWFDALAAPGYADKLFHDWSHLNVAGSRHYLKSLATSMATGSYPVSAYCPP